MQPTLYAAAGRFRSLRLNRLAVVTVQRPRLVNDALDRHADGTWFGIYGESTVTSAFQPIVDIRVAEPALWAVEALARPQRRGEDLSPLGWFADGAAGDRHFLDWLCRVVHLRNAAVLGLEVPVFINLDPSVFDDIANSLEQLSIMVRRMSGIGLGPSSLVIEVTEVPEHSHEVLDALVQGLKTLEVGVAVDDFGQEAADWSRVKRVKPSYVKLDRALVSSLVGDSTGQSMLTRMCDEFRSIGAVPIAEGVEEPGWFVTLRDCGVPLVQGYAVAPPVRVESLLRQRRRALPLFPMSSW